MDLEAYQANQTGCLIWSLNLVECQQTTVSNLLSIKKYHFDGSFEKELKEKLLARYTVGFFRFKVIFLFRNHRDQVSYFCNSVNSADL